jgi:hypothetical protein
MSSRSDLQSDLERLTNDATQVANENTRLREINSQMLVALQMALPIPQVCLPGTVDPDWTEQVIAKTQNAIADVERDFS